MVHTDNFDQGRSSYSYIVRGDDGRATPLQLAAMPDSLRIGMRVVAAGTMATDGFSLDADHITVLAAAPLQSTADDVLFAPITNNVLVILVKFAGTTEAFSQAQVDQVMRTNGNSVANYYQEASYGKQLLNVTVTPWLLSATTTPVSCDYTAIGNAGDTAAAAAGYSLASYQNRFYVFPNRSDCGWLGAAYVGSPRIAWSNGYNLLNVYGHELGHNFGLLHAASLYCPGQVIGGSCSVSDHGTYPYVTSSNTVAGNAAAGSGVGPDAVGMVLGIAKAYTTRVGSGPFPTELHDAVGKGLGERGHEFGTVTGRPRRCGWFDACMVRQAVKIGGIQGLALTKLDVLDGMAELKICTGYRVNGGGDAPPALRHGGPGGRRADLRDAGGLERQHPRRPQLCPAAGRGGEIRPPDRGAGRGAGGAAEHQPRPRRHHHPARPLRGLRRVRDAEPCLPSCCCWPGPRGRSRPASSAMRGSRRRSRISTSTPARAAR